MNDLVLSLFPGIGLLDAAFEAEGFCVVRGPDKLWGGDVKLFHPPPGVFAGVIGGPPCQRFSRLQNLVRHNKLKAGKPYVAPEDFIPEFVRVVYEAQPQWFLMENVPDAPVPGVLNYLSAPVLLRDVWVGGETKRLRRFSFGTVDGRRLPIEVDALCNPSPLPAVLANGGQWVPVKIGGSGREKRMRVRGRGGRLYGDKSRSYFREAVKAQGLPEGFDLPPFKVVEKIRAIGNGVPFAMGRAVARAVARATGANPRQEGQVSHAEVG